MIKESIKSQAQDFKQCNKQNNKGANMQQNKKLSAREIEAIKKEIKETLKDEGDYEDFIESCKNISKFKKFRIFEDQDALIDWIYKFENIPLRLQQYFDSEKYIEVLESTQEVIFLNDSERYIMPTIIKGVALWK